MRMKRILAILVMVLLASAVPLAVTPAAAIYEVYEKKLPCDADENDELTKDELVAAILPYMLEGGDLKLDDVGDAAWVYAYWDGKPKTVVDMGSQKTIPDRTITRYRPVERIVALSNIPELRSVKAADRIVGVSSSVTLTTGMDKTLYPEFIGSFPIVDSKDMESIIYLHPDAAILSYGTLEKDIDVLESAGITAFRCRATNAPQVAITIEGSEKLGYLLDKEEEAKEFIDFLDGWMGLIKERVDEIPEENKPTVYCQHCRGSMRKKYMPYAGSIGDFGHGYSTLSRFAGGKSIFSDLPFATGDVTVEEVIARDPEIIVWCDLWGSSSKYFGSYDRDAGDITVIKAVRDEVMNRAELTNITAIKNGEVYAIDYKIYCCGGLYFVGISYLAKIFHPTLFEDLDPNAIHQEYLTRFQGLDYDLNEHGVFVYHPEHFPDGH